MPRCEVGDMAVCIGGSAVGTFVHVEAPSMHPQEPDAPAWVCRIAGDCRCVQHMGLFEMRIIAKRGELVTFLDRHLQPIRPPKTPIAIPAPPIEETA